VWYLYLYGVTSFVVEFYRYIPVHLLGLSPNQWTAVVIVPGGYIASRILRRRPQASPAPAIAPDVPAGDKQEPASPE